MTTVGREVSNALVSAIRTVVCIRRSTRGRSPMTAAALDHRLQRNRNRDTSSEDGRSHKGMSRALSHQNDVVPNCLDHVAVEAQGLF